MAAQDERLVGITPAMREGSGMVEFEKRFPDRYFDVGIAEQHAVTFAAGLACEGMKPVVAIYSTFLQRAYDQLIHDVAIQNLPVVFALDRAGLVGADGATHAGAYDIALPALHSEHERAARPTRTNAGSCSPPRSAEPSGGGALSARRRHRRRRRSRRWRTAVRQGRDPPRGQAHRHPRLRHACSIRRSQAAEELDATVANMRFVKPLDVELVLQLARRMMRS